jgi:hypothetical protein
LLTPGRGARRHPCPGGEAVSRVYFFFAGAVGAAAAFFSGQ